MKNLLVIIVTVMITGCTMFHFKPEYRQESRNTFNVEALSDFDFQLEYPGDITGKRFVLTGEEGRWFDLLGYNRVIGFVKQRNQLRDTGELLLAEHRAKVEAHNLFVKDYNKMVEDVNSQETSLTVWTYLGSAEAIVLTVLLLIILL